MQDAMSRRDSGSDDPQNGNIKDLIKGYVDNNLSRRQFLAGLAGLGLSASAASSLAKDLNPFVTRTDDADPEPLPGWARSVHGTGGQLIIEQLKAAGVEHLFINASSGQGPVLDALVDEPNMHIIKAVEEGNLVGMADGYARASGKTPFVMFARPGLPNGMTMMFNAWKDYIPMVVLTDDVPMAMLGQDGFEAMDHMASMTQTMTKWHWNSGAISKIPEDLRRAFKFASTRPSGPVFLSVPNDLIAERSEAIIMDQTKFQVPMQIAPDPAAIRQIAKILLEAENPMILAGDEIGYCDAQKEVVELAELLGATVTKTLATTWSKPFPCVHPLYVETYVPTSRFPGKLDVLLNLGSRMPLAFGDKLQIESSVKLIQIRLDSENLARVYPTDQAVIADIKLATAALIEEVNRQAPSQSRLKRIAGERLQRVRSHKGQRREVLTEIAKRRWNDAPLSGERLINELEKLLDKDSIVVSENDTYRYHIDHYFRFGPEDKGFFANAGFALGWGLPAAFGVKLALPDKPVVSIVSDGGFLFSGPQPIWSYARHKAPIIVIVMNNRSYNDERNRILQVRGRSYETGLDMSCYLGDPDVNYAQLASGFGVEGEVIEDADSIKAAVQRAQSATKEGRAYLLDVHVARTGSLANSTWHPEYHISSLRSRQV